MLQNVKSKQKGFTIIEVLIVLVIAGLIMLIVFLAVPALQRNSRNTQRRNDVSTYLGAVNEWLNNNGGREIQDADLGAANTGINALAKLGFYATEPTSVLSGAQSGAVTADTFQLVKNARCNPNSDGSTLAGTGVRQIAIRYAVENSGSTPTPQCQES